MERPLRRHFLNLGIFHRFFLSDRALYHYRGVTVTMLGRRTKGMKICWPIFLRGATRD